MDRLGGLSNDVGLRAVDLAERHVLGVGKVPIVLQTASSLGIHEDTHASHDVPKVALAALRVRGLAIRVAHQVTHGRIDVLGRYHFQVSTSLKARIGHAVDAAAYIAIEDTDQRLRNYKTVFWTAARSTRSGGDRCCR